MSSTPNAVVWVALLSAASCGSGRVELAPPPFSSADGGEKELDATTPPGLSDLTLDAQGRLWAVAERPAALVQIQPAGQAPLPITGLPAGVEPESLAFDAASGAFLLGTEGPGDRAEDWIFTLKIEGQAAVATPRVAMPWSPWGIVADGNHGIEALCVGTALWVAGEIVVTDGGRREAPLARAEGSGWTAMRVPLQTENGKISALACDPDGSLWAVERHFKDLALLHIQPGHGPVSVRRCALPPWMGPGGPNWEGLVVEGEALLWVSDNQNATVSGPSFLARLPRVCSPGEPGEPGVGP